MKKAIDLLVIYLSFLIIGIIVSTFCYSAYVNILDLIIGNRITVFDKTYLIKSMMYVSYCVLFAACPVVSYYRIRRPGGIPQFIAYFLIVFITWCILFPLFCNVEKHISNKIHNNVKIESNYLTQDYFRKVGNKVYYFTKEFESENNNVATSTAIVIDTSTNGNVDYKTVRDIDSMDFNKEARPFNDILVKQNFTNSRITFPMNLSYLIEKLSNVMQFKLYYVLYFLSFVIVLSSVYALTNILNWKLLNSCLLIFVTISIICLNSNEYLPIISNFKIIMQKTKFFTFLSKYVYESFLFVINVFFSFVFCVFGFIKFIYHCKVKKEE